MLVGTISLAVISTGGAVAAQRTESVGEFQQVSYPVTSLVFPIPDFALGSADRLVQMRRLGECERWLKETGDLPPNAASRTMDEFLIRLITKTISPESWSANGGTGTIEYSPNDHKLTVKQYQYIQRRIAALLAEIESVLDMEVAVQIRLVVIEPKVAENFVNIFDIPQFDPSIAFLNDRQVKAWLESFQRNRKTNVMQAPKVSVFNGQAAQISVGDHVSVAGLKPPKADKNFGGEYARITPLSHMAALSVCEPVDGKVEGGMITKILPIVSADRRHVQLKFDLTLANLVWSEAQEPQQQKLSVNQTLVLPDKGTAVLRVCKTTSYEPQDIGPPVLSSIPYINRLFTNVGKGKQEEELFVFITARTTMPEPAR
jgi:hypothetical protein